MPDDVLASPVQPGASTAPSAAPNPGEAAAGGRGAPDSPDSPAGPAPGRSGPEFRSSPPPADTPAPSTSTSDEDADLAMARLRELLLGPERQRVAQLQERLEHFDVSPEAVSRVLPEAIKLRPVVAAGPAAAPADGSAPPAPAPAVDKRLADSLAPTIEQSLRSSIRKDPGPLIDVLFPLMGPVIRKSITDALEKMVQSLNQAVEHSLSLRGWQWRIEAWRTGKPFGEVVLLHTLVYRVEQVFLIHRETGLLLAHAVADTVNEQKDGDMISGMFTAIRDFVQDSFGTDPGEELDDLKVGRRTVWVRQEPKAVLAAVITGTAPAALRTTLQAALAKVHAEQCDALEAFAGDTSCFEKVQPVLRSLLVHSDKPPADDEGNNGGEGGEAGAADGAGGKPKRKVPVPLLVVTAAVLAALSTWIYFARRETARWERYVAWLKAQPGVVVLDAQRRGGRYVVTGLRDPAAEPEQRLAGHLADEHLDPARAEFHFEPYQSLLPAFILRRAETALRPPPTVHLSLSPDGVLSAAGAAPADWLATARAIAPAVSGVSRLDAAGVAVSTDPTLLKKAENLLRPPAGVTLHLGPVAAGGELLGATGEAPHAWIEQAERLAPLLPGVSRFDASGLTDVDGPEAIESRAAAALRPPAAVRLKASDGLLAAAGRAPHEWVLRARRAAAELPGVKRYDDSGLVDVDLERVADLRRAVESARVRFVRYNSELPSDQGGVLDAVAGDVRQLLAAADAVGRNVDVRVVGHTDWVGTEEGKMHVSELRAQNVASALAARGVPPGRLIAVGVGDRDLTRTRAPGTGRAQGEPDRVGADQLVTFEVAAPEGTDVGAR